MAQMVSSAGISPLDEAYGKRLEGAKDEALRVAVAIVEASPQQLGAAALGAQLLVDAKRPLLAGEIAARLVDAYVRRGDLPSAVVAAHIAIGAGEKGAPLFEEIAGAFGRGAKRAQDVAPAPPPLPAQATIPPALAKLSGDALLDRAESALQKFLAEDDPLEADAPVPKLPLFGALAPKTLERMLAALRVTDVGSGHVVIQQGEEGRDAFVVARGFLQVVRKGEDETETALAALGPGAIFGEMALVSDAPRAASVVAVEPAQLLCIPRAELESLAAKDAAIGAELGAFCHMRMLSNLVRTSAILRAVTPGERTSLMDRFRSRSFAPGDALVTHGDEGAGLFLIASGGVVVSSSDAEGDRIVLARLGPGDVVGEISLVLRRPATADVVAEHPTVALELTRDDFMDAIRAHPAMLNELYELATKREEETRSVVAQEALDVEDVVLL